MSTQQSEPLTRILVVDDEPAARSALSEMLRDEGYEVQSAADGYKALGRIDNWIPDVVITDVNMPALGGIELMKKLRERYPDIAVIIMTGFGSVEGAVEAMQLGADDYLSKPIHFPQLLVIVQRVLQHRALQREARALRERLRARHLKTESQIIGQSKPFRELLDLVKQVADSPISVLIVGETGTGKQFIAQMLHQSSSRAAKKFVSVRCGALDEKAFERELFGFEDDDALKSDGRLGEADGGTLFLDDICELRPASQSQLLQFLQDRAYKRVNGTTTLKADVRLVTSSDRDLEAEVREGRFREDLYYRLNVLTLRTPSLRERNDDISLLATHFLHKYTEQHNKTLSGFSERALGVLRDFDWPGNIRQLEHCVERAVVMARGAEIEPRDLPRELMSKMRGDDTLPSIPGATLRELERYAILRTLEHVGGSTSKAAKMLGISPRKIQYRLNEYRSVPHSSASSVIRGSRRKSPSMPGKR